MVFNQQISLLEVLHIQQSGILYYHGTGQVEFEMV